MPGQSVLEGCTGPVHWGGKIPVGAELGAKMGFAPGG